MASLLDALAMAESSGRFGIVGPKTPYGQALGGYQMLPNTAQEMARKKGLPWRQDLMTSPTEEGKRYQRQLAEAYINEGIERTGNVRDAIKYYHGGPNRKLWGPKTNAHAEKVLALAGPEAWKAQGKDESIMPQQPVRLPMSGPEPTGLAGILAQQPQPPMDAEGNPLMTPDMGMLSPQSVNGRDPLAAKPKAFGKGGSGWSILGIIGDALQTMGGGQATFAPAMAEQRERSAAMEQWREKVAAERAERMRPRLMQTSQGIVSVDPATNQVTPVYDEPPKEPDPLREERLLQFLMSRGMSEEEAFETIKRSVGGAGEKPHIIKYDSGNETLTVQVNSDGTRTVIARAPRWQPERPSSSGSGSSLPKGFILE